MSQFVYQRSLKDPESDEGLSFFGLMCNMMMNVRSLFAGSMMASLLLVSGSADAGGYKYYPLEMKEPIKLSNEGLSWSYQGHVKSLQKTVSCSGAPEILSVVDGVDCASLKERCLISKTSSPDQVGAVFAEIYSYTNMTTSGEKLDLPKTDHGNFQVGVLELGFQDSAGNLRLDPRFQVRSTFVQYRPSLKEKLFGEKDADFCTLQLR